MFSFLIISLLILGLGAGPIYCAFLFKNQKGWLIGLLGVLIASGQALSIYIFFSTGTFFVAGVTCLLFPIALIAALIMLFWRKNYQEQLASDRSLRHWYWAGMILIPIILVLPFFELLWIQRACFGLNRHAAQPIISALEEYHAENGNYPETLDELVPEYFASLPPGRCAPFSSSNSEKLKFEINICQPDDIPILTVPIGSGEWIQRYNLGTGDWARISFLDGACSYLE